MGGGHITFEHEFEQILAPPESVLRRMGVEVRDGRSGWRHRFVFGSAVIAILSCMLGFVRKLVAGITFKEFTDFVPKIIVCIAATFKIAAVHRSEEKLSRLLRRLKLLHRITREDADETTSAGAHISKELALLLLVMRSMQVMCFVTLMAFLSSPFVLALYNYCVGGDVGLTCIVPLSYGIVTCGEDAFAWPVFYVHTCLLGSAVISYTLGNDILVFSYCTLLNGGFVALGARLRCAKPDEVAHLVRRHQLLIDMVMEFDALVSKSTLLFFLTGTFLFCFCGFIVTVLDRSNLSR